MFLVGDAPPHMDYAQDVKYPEVLRIARERDIMVNAVQAGGARDTERVWREIAQIGNGRYIPIPQDGGQLVVIETPYDIEIIELQGRINGTVIPYGPRMQRSSVEQKTGKCGGAAPRSRSEMAGYMNKRYATASAGAEAITGAAISSPTWRPAGRSSRPSRTTNCRTRCASSKPAERQALIDKRLARAQGAQRAHDRAGQEARRLVAEQRKKRAAPKTGDSFDRAVEET